MNKLRIALRNNPWQTSLGITLIYFLVFAAPAIKSSQSFGRGKGVTDVASMNSQLPMEIGLVISILIVAFFLGLGKDITALKPQKGSLKFVIAPLLFTVVLLGIAMLLASTKQLTLLDVIGLQGLIVLLTMTLLVGVFEETLFRGILFNGAMSRFGPVFSVTIVAVMFGAMHYVNFVSGQPFAQTTFQVLHAASDGFMYGALRLRLGVLWPVILLHGFWDATVSIVGSTAGVLAPAAPGVAETATYSSSSLVMLLPGAIYGAFVLWRWSKWQHAQGEA